MSDTLIEYWAGQPVGYAADAGIVLYADAPEAALRALGLHECVGDPVQHDGQTVGVQAGEEVALLASAPLQALRVLGAARPAVPPCPADTSIAALGPPQCRVGPWDIPPR